MRPRNDSDLATSHDGGSATSTTRPVWQRWQRRPDVQNWGLEVAVTGPPFEVERLGRSSSGAIPEVGWHSSVEERYGNLMLGKGAQMTGKH
eukprot:843087-Alexandrium_andersonii.AAC.1